MICTINTSGSIQQASPANLDGLVSFISKGRPAQAVKVRFFFSPLSQRFHKQVNQSGADCNLIANVLVFFFNVPCQYTPSFTKHIDCFWHCQNQKSSSGSRTGPGFQVSMTSGRERSLSVLEQLLHMQETNFFFKKPTNLTVPYI